jgi:hypothetical protein
MTALLDSSIARAGAGSRGPTAGGAALRLLRSGRRPGLSVSPWATSTTRHEDRSGSMNSGNSCLLVTGYAKPSTTTSTPPSRGRQNNPTFRTSRRSSRARPRPADNGKWDDGASTSHRALSVRRSARCTEGKSNGKDTCATAGRLGRLHGWAAGGRGSLCPAARQLTCSPCDMRGRCPRAGELQRRS